MAVCTWEGRFFFPLALLFRIYNPQICTHLITAWRGPQQERQRGDFLRSEWQVEREVLWELARWREESNLQVVAACTRLMGRGELSAAERSRMLSSVRPERRMRSRQAAGTTEVRWEKQLWDHEEPRRRRHSKKLHDQICVLETS